MKAHKALLIGIIATLAVLAGALLLYTFVLSSPKLIIQSSPDNAEITFDNAVIHSHSITTTVGDHLVKLTADGYVTYQKKITLTRAQKLVLPVLMKNIPTPVVLSASVTNSPKLLDKSDVYFVGNLGHTLYRTQTVTGQTAVNVVALTPDSLTDISKVQMRPDGAVALMKKADGVYLYDFARHDLLNQTLTLWGTNIDDFAWSPSSIQAAYTYYGTNGEQTLILSDVQNANLRRVYNLTIDNIDHPTITWSPDGQQIFLKSNSTQTKTNYLYVYDIFAQKMTRLTTEGDVEGAKWSPNGQYVAYVAPGTTSSGGTSNLLWVAKSDGSGVIPLNVELSGVSKIAWVNSSKSIIAVTSSATGQKLVNVTLDGTVTDYQYTKPSGIDFSPDNLITIPNDDRVMFTVGNQLMSISLTTPTYE
ncbi:MAG: PEGA domain-containing protein [Patescibacteria group bacterium]|jgi:hypothetical protein